MGPGKWAIGVAGIMAGGLALGAVLGNAADPTLKEPPPQWWQLAGNDRIVPSSDHAFFDSGPENLEPFGGYRPDLDYDAVALNSPIRAEELAVLEEPAPIPDDLPIVTYGTAASAADEAQAAAAEALAVQAPAETAPVEARRAELAGIY